MTILTPNPAPIATRCAISIGMLCGTTALLFSCIVASAQAPAAPKPGPASAPSTSSMAPLGTPVTAANLADRPYGPTWPQPSFPSTPRAAKQFTVEYVYRYAESDYTPAVKIETVKHADAAVDTPEHLLVAFISAVRTQDYDWWLSLWDTRSQQIIADLNRTQKHDPAYWKASWQQSFAGKPVTLYSRLETVRDVVLEYSLGEQRTAQKGITIPLTMRRENNRWALTLELNDSGFVPSLGQQTMTAPLDFAPSPTYTGLPQSPVVAHTQQLFFKNQSRGASSATEFVW